jgi:flagella basal body P-ring formation protein FlgA
MQRTDRIRFRGTRQWIALCCVLLAGALPECDAAVIRLHPTVEITSTVVRLGDVAEILDADPQVVARLSRVMLAPAPAAGRSTALAFDAIRARLASQGFNLAELEFAGTSLVTVSGGRLRGDGLGAAPANDLAHRRAEELVSRAVARHVREQNRDAGHVTVELALSPEQGALVSQSSSSRLEPSGGQPPYLGAQKLRIAFHDRQGQARQFDVDCRVTPLPSVLVPRTSLAKGHVLRAEDLTFKQLESTAGGITWFERLEQIVGQEAKKSLRAGEVITAKDVRGVPLIRQGDIVTVYSRSGGIEVRMEAKSRGDGTLGDSVKLISLDGRRELNAKVSGFHEATVIPTAPPAAAPPATGTGIRLLSHESSTGKRK